MGVLAGPGRRHPHRGQGLPAEPGRLGLRRPRPVGPDELDEVALDPLQRIEAGGRVLEHQRQPVAPGPPPGLGIRGEVDPVEHDPPGPLRHRRQDAEHGPPERRLPASALADQPEALARRGPPGVTPSTARTGPRARPVGDRQVVDRQGGVGAAGSVARDRSGLAGIDHPDRAGQLPLGAFGGGEARRPSRSGRSASRPPRGRRRWGRRRLRRRRRGSGLRGTCRPPGRRGLRMSLIPSPSSDMPVTRRDDGQAREQRRPPGAGADVADGACRCRSPTRPSAAGRRSPGSRARPGSGRRRRR